MDMKNLLLGLLFIASLLNTGCATKKVASFDMNYEVECMGTGTDDTQLLKAWGYGSNSEKAIIQAKKNAVHAIIFKGITSGKPGCMRNPLSTQAGIEQQYNAYFNAFFADNGKYLSFISISNDGSINPADRIKVNGKYKIGVLVSVKHASLRNELENAGILKRLDNGF